MFPVEEFGEYKINLHNGNGMGEVVNMAEWVKVHKGVD